VYINLFCGEVVGTVEKIVINGAFGVFVRVLLGEIYIVTSLSIVYVGLCNLNCTSKNV